MLLGKHNLNFSAEPIAAALDHGADIVITGQSVLSYFYDDYYFIIIISILLQAAVWTAHSSSVR